MAILTMDIGQKFIRYGFFDDKGNLTEKGQYQVPRQSAKDFYKSIADLVDESDMEIKAISISFPGFINVKDKVAIRAGSLRFLDGHNISKDLHQYINKEIEIFIENNTNCAAIAEKLNGNAQDVEDFVVITLGHGVGGAIFVNNKLLRGSGYSAGEFGMMITDYSARQFMTAHELASTSALINDYATMRGIPSELIEEYQIMAELDNPKVREVIEKWATYVAICIFNLSCTLNPQRFLIGGALSQNNELIPLIKNRLMQIPNWSDFETEIQSCRFYNDASLYGAYWAYIGSKNNVS